MQRPASAFELDVTTGELRWSPESTARRFDLESLLARIHPEEREAVRHGFMQAIFECRELEAAFHVVQTDRELQLVELRARVVRGFDGRASRMLGLCAPSTQHTRVRRAA